MSYIVETPSKLYSAFFFCLLLTTSTVVESMNGNPDLSTVAKELGTGLTNTGTSFYSRLQGQDSVVDPALAYPQQQQVTPPVLNPLDETAYNGIVTPGLTAGYGLGNGPTYGNYRQGSKGWGGFGRKNGYVGGRPDVQYGLKY